MPFPGPVNAKGQNGAGTSKSNEGGSDGPPGPPGPGAGPVPGAYDTWDANPNASRAGAVAVVYRRILTGVGAGTESRIGNRDGPAATADDDEAVYAADEAGR
jgi:hypothetical protein